MKLLPDSSETRSLVAINNIALTRELFDIPLPGPDPSEEALRGYFVALAESSLIVRDGGWLSGFHGLGPKVIKREFLDFNFTQYEQTMVAGEVRIRPDYQGGYRTCAFQLEVIRGRFDPQATGDAIAVCTECPSHDEEEYEGVTVYKWTEGLNGELRLRMRPPAFDSMGRGGNIVITEDFAIRTLEAKVARMLIDASQGKEMATLADVKDFELLAKELDKLGVHSALMTDQLLAVDESRERAKALQSRVI